MSKLEFKYVSDQRHQIEAVEAVCGLFRGQRFAASTFTARSRLLDAPGGQTTAFDVPGYGNGLRLSPDRLLENLHAVQEDNCLAQSAVLTDGRLRDFTVEMETGTGKTYVYIRTIYELNARFGLTKFVIVVPSVAIREGVVKSFESTRAHFEGLYDRTPLNWFVYNPKDMAPVGNFATSPAIQVMIINIDSFNKGLDEQGAAREGNLFHRPSEKLPGGQSPQELVSACSPVVVIDEPQSVDNTPKAKRAIASLSPLFVLRYSATHREPYNMVYRLTPVDAFEQHLVKGICVDSLRADADLNGAYVKLVSVTPAAGRSKIRARLTIDARDGRGGQRRKDVTVSVGRDLYALSGENADYEAGWIVSNIDSASGRECVEFLNGTALDLGQAVGDVSDALVKRAQIQRTIADHLQRQFELYPRGVKVLSLFFIDKVANYRLYEPDVHAGPYARMFEEEYRALVHGPASRSARRACGLEEGTWAECYAHEGIPLPEDPGRVHEGYFSKDGRGRIKDTSGATEADTSTFELIMRRKETLIAFPDGADRDKDVAFIFSHSALREGWDNPNVFQVCTLLEGGTEISKRQKIGRGLRLCVDQDGRRCADPAVNVLTVVAGESFGDFAAGLQRELEEAGFRFGVVTPETFNKVVVARPDGAEERLGAERSRRIYEHLVAAGLVDGAGRVSPELKGLAERGEVGLPEGLEAAADQVAAIILRKAARSVPVFDKGGEVEVELRRDVAESPAFQELWERIRRRTRFQVSVDSEAIVRRAVEEIGRMPEVAAPRIRSERAEVAVGDAGVVASQTSSSLVEVAGERAYELPDPIGELVEAVGLTRRTVGAILAGCGRMDEFERDPETFLSQVAGKIAKAKNEAVAEGIAYVELPEEEWYTMRDLEVPDLKAYLGRNAWEPRHADKSAYSYVVYDSDTVEQPFAAALDRQEEVLVYAKLPASFKIDTPLGTYNPDWAYVEETPGGGRRVYFVTETKGGRDGEPALRDAERMKIDCARRHFDALGLGEEFRYGVETTYRPMA